MYIKIILYLDYIIIVYEKILISTALLAGVLSYAGGFRVSLQGVKQLAMAHTVHMLKMRVLHSLTLQVCLYSFKLSVAVGFGISSKVTYQNLNTLESY
jgi:long-chain fatty acid transport protein